MTTPVEVRLPTSVRPETYAITMAPDLTNLTFRGDENIIIEIKESTDTIVLHSLDLEITHCELTFADRSELKATDISFDKDSETVTLSFGQSLSPGRARLGIGFAGVLAEQLRGFYRSRYTGPNGRQYYLATTQFEATDARRAFPCWDEPAIKAKFRISLLVPAELDALSNMPVESETNNFGGTKTVRFAISPAMSTYLLAFIVGEFSYIEATAANDTLIRVYTTRGKEEQGRLALETSVKLLSYYNDYFGVPYPLPKLDHIAIPDFAAGAMENWGAITYRETALLYDPENSAANTRQRVTEVVAHEMAHMWFGDLVTMEWWDNLWLNESFASWMACKAMDHLYPEWNMWTQFVSQHLNAGLGLDGLRNSHPIEVPVQNPAQIGEIFDAISYSKGGSVLRMLEGFLGEGPFRKGLQAYISGHQYANARTEDLWSALEGASRQRVADIMESWVKQTGYPLVKVDMFTANGQAYFLYGQHRFLYEHILNAKTELDEALWQIPVGIIRRGSKPQTNFLMTQRDVPSAVVEDYHILQDWLKANAGQSGFYRVRYDSKEFDKLRTSVSRGDLPAIDRLGLQGDTYALARAGYMSATHFLSLAEAYDNEMDATVLGDLSANLGGIEIMILKEASLPDFDKLGRSIFRKIAEKVGWDPKPNEGHLDSLRRSIVLGQAGWYGDPKVVAEAKGRFQRYLTDPSSLHPDLRGVVLGLAGQTGDKSTYDTISELEKRTELQEEKLRLLRALARFPQPELLRRTLEYSLSANVRSQDTITVVTSVAGNRIGRDMAWEFVKNNWDEFDRRYGKGGFAITNLVGFTGGFSTAERAADVEEFFKAHPTPAATRSVQQSLERIRLNVKWLERNKDDLASWLPGRDRRL
ncbi:MAG: M1 family peptidase [Dehalococcoidia bacterium]|nr:M1 family peptidase [Dehalococcoidia bacterium]